MLFFALICCTLSTLAQQPVERATIERMAVRLPTQSSTREVERFLTHMGCPVYVPFRWERRWMEDPYGIGLLREPFYFMRIGIQQ